MPRKHREDTIRYGRIYRAANREAINCKGREYRDRHREEINRKARERYQRNAETYKRQTKEYRDRHRADRLVRENAERGKERVVSDEPTPHYIMRFDNPAAYWLWIKESVEEDSKHLSPIGIRHAPRGLFPISHQRWPLYRRLLDSVLGPRCRGCGFVGRLELAHLAYFSDSVGPKDRSNGASFRRVIEALKHPDRFIRLCSVCHDIFDHAVRSGGQPFLERMTRLLARKEEAERASRALQEQGGGTT